MSRARSVITNAAGTAGITRRAVLAGTGGLAASMALAPSRAWAQAPFLAGQRIEILSGNSEGSAVNSQLRVFGDAVQRLYPGTQVVVRPNTGGTADLAAAILANAEPDGLTVGTAAMDSLLRRGSEPGLHDISEFTMIGSMRRSNSLIYASTASGIETVADLIGRPSPAILAVRSTASSAYLASLFCNAMLGTRIQPVTGYGSAERDLAFLTGEADLVYRTSDTGARFIEDGTGRALLKFDDVALPELFGDPPGLADFDYDPAHRWIVDYFNASSYSRLLVAPEGVPADRIEALRDVFMQVVADAGFLAGVTENLTVTPTRGDALQAALDSVVAELGDLDDLAGRVEGTLACGLHIAETGEACPAPA